MDNNAGGWFLLIAGVIIAGFGLIWILAPSASWFGRLPGDLAIEGENYRFYFPITTTILLSLLFTVVATLIRHFFG